MQKIAHEPAQISYDEVIGLPLDLKLVADAIKEELSSCHEGPVSYLDKSGLKVIGTRWVHTNKGDAANPFIRARLVAQETKRVSELTPEDASSKFAATPTLESLKVMLSGGMTGMRRALAEEKVRFYDICRACRTIVIEVPREDDECTSGAQFWRKPCTERRMLHSASMLRVRMP